MAVKSRKYIGGRYTVIGGKLTFTVVARNVTDEEVLQGLQLLKEELNLQIAEKSDNKLLNEKYSG